MNGEIRFVDFDEPPAMTVKKNIDEIPERIGEYVSLGDYIDSPLDYIELILSSCLSSAEERIALAQAMAEPIKISLEYQAIGRKMLMVDKLIRISAFVEGPIRFLDAEDENEWLDQIPRSLRE